MRPIDGDALKEKLQEQQKYGSIADSRGRAKAIVEVIHAPTIEVEPVNPKMTNRERFMREISNEDLAKILKDASGGNCPCQYCIEMQDTCKLKPCIEGVIEWLESPSDKGETESE